MKGTNIAICWTDGVELIWPPSREAAAHVVDLSPFGSQRLNFHLL